MRDESVWAEVSLRQLTENARLIAEHIGPDVSLIAVVKANAYGHGLIPCTMSLWASGVERFAVAKIEEALELRTAGLKAPILVLGYVPAGQLPEALRQGIDLTISELQTASYLSQLASHTETPALVHIKIDTGMHRLGFAPEEAADSYAEVRTLPGLQINGIFSHFADVADRDFSDEQLGRFQSVLFELQRHGMTPPLVHLANSQATLELSEAYFDAVRPGRILYGLSPVLPGMAPVLSLKTRVALVRKVAAGETIGYGRTYKTEKPIHLAVLPIGYADGFRRHLSDKGSVLVSGRRCPVVGRVCMNMTMIDVSGLPVLPQIGEEVVIFGNQGHAELTAKDMAEAMDTISYEIVSHLDPTIPRRYSE